ncbi:MAG: hypothetical protein BGN96_01625 [Bacteroidales bacterium 45-6]|nr:MAG: hypothetical protein BGN96_01625 [Bacteroidales bacterium 45-6]
MKTKKAIHTIIFCAIAFFSQAQIQETGRANYFTEGSTWTKFTVNTLINPPDYENHSQYFLGKDTLVNGVSYKKILYWDIQQEYPVGILREAGGKVYAKLNIYGEDSSEFLLYDFTLKEGDLFVSTAAEGVLADPEGLVVTKIDTIRLLNGESRKRFHFDRTAAWIEGIGSVGGLFNDTYGHVTDFTQEILGCFRQANVLLYKDTVLCKGFTYEECNVCDAELGISRNRNQSGISFSGNTVKDNLSINITGEALNASLSIYVINMAGNTISLKQAKEAKHVVIDFSGYKPGVYFIHIEAPGIRYSDKIVKI